MRPKGLRQARLNEAIKEVLSLVLLTKSQDPRLRSCIVTQVALTPDFGLATVFWRTLGPTEEREGLSEALEHAVPFLRRELQASLKMRVLPDLRFRYDEVPDEAARIDALLEHLH
jgi:ribosome-binding factor A